MFLIFLLLFSSPSLVHKKRITLDIPLSSTHPRIVAGEDGTFFYASYWDHVIHHVDSQGKLIRTFGGPGQGPREMIKPSAMVLMEKGKTLVVAEANGRVFKITPDRPNEEFQVIQRFFPCGNMVKWDEDHLLFCFGGRQGTKAYFHVMDLSGRLIKSWFTETESARMKEGHPIQVGCEAVVVTRDHCVFYQDGAYPKLWEVSRGLDEWVLKPPQHFKPAPNEPFELNKRFDGVAVEEFYSSFTHLSNLSILDNSYLTVCWTLGKPYPAALDIYKMPQRRLVLSNIVLPGIVFGSSGRQLFVLEIKELDGGAIDLDEAHLIHIYEFEI